MYATSEYLNKPLRTIEKAMRDAALLRFKQRCGYVNEEFELSQEFRDYRLAFRDTVQGSCVSVGRSYSP